MPEDDGVSRRHWKSSKSRRQCETLSCKAKFSFVNRKHHCRKCGGVSTKPLEPKSPLPRSYFTYTFLPLASL